MISCFHASPIGALRLTAQAGRLLRIQFAGNADGFSFSPSTDRSSPDRMVLGQACEQLDEYFDGKRKQFDLPIALMGTPFQLEVWSLLYRIPFGKTVSYSALASILSKPDAARAVGAANAANPLPIIVPCHRVIASDGSLAGFSGGVGIKRALLDHECAAAPLFAPAFS